MLFVLMCFVMVKYLNLYAVVFVWLGSVLFFVIKIGFLRFWVDGVVIVVVLYYDYKPWNSWASGLCLKWVNGNW